MSIGRAEPSLVFFVVFLEYGFCILNCLNLLKIFRNGKICTKMAILYSKMSKIIYICAHEGDH